MSKKNMMKLEALTEMLDKIDMTPFPISDKELCDRYEALYTGAINDVLREKLLHPKQHSTRPACHRAYVLLYPSHRLL